MVVAQDLFDEIVQRLKTIPRLSLDTETTGLRPYHDSRLFSIIIGSPSNNYYFDFKELTKTHFDLLQINLFDDTSKTWYIHNAKFDMAMLAKDHCCLKGKVFCTMALGRVEYNEHFKYDLDSSAQRIGFEKDDAVKKYIIENKLYDQVLLPGKKARKKDLHFDQVPKEIMVPYAERDAEITYLLGKHLQDSLTEQAKQLSGINELVENEMELTKVCFRMERLGLQADIPFCKRAIAHYTHEYRGCLNAYSEATESLYVGSWQSLSKVFIGEKDKWVYGKPTKKNGQINPKFDGDVLKKFDHPLAKIIIKLRDMKSKLDFFNGFVYHADEQGIIHPNWNPGSTVSGRFSSSDPNFQNIEKARDKASMQEEFLVRRAIVPRPGYIFIMPDYDQVEYRLMLDYAAAKEGHTTPLVDKVLGGLDVHAATQEIVDSDGSMGFTRSQAKAVNFGLLYGQGLGALSDSLGVSVFKARRIRSKVLGAAPEIGGLIAHISKLAKARGFIFNWIGRKLHLTAHSFAYGMPNRLIQSGSADITKFAMVQIAKYLDGLQSRIIMTIHDELVIEVHESEIDVVPHKVKEIMEGVYPSKYLPLTVGMCWSDRSLADKIEGFPSGTGAGGKV